MRSFPNHILRGVPIDGVKFCSPSGDLEDASTLKNQEQEHLKTLEDFWFKKGQQEGRTAGFDEGWKEGEKEGRRKGSQEGHAKGLEEGRAEGLKEGHDKGKEEAEAALREVLERAQEVVAKLIAQKGQFLDHARSEIIRFAMTISERIIRRELENPAILQELLRSLLEQSIPIIDEKGAQLFLSPEDFQAIQPKIGELYPHPEQIKGLQLSADKNLQRGDCRVETAFGVVNFDIERQLEDIEKKVLEVSDSNLPSMPESSSPEE